MVDTKLSDTSARFEPGACSITAIVKRKSRGNPRMMLGDNNSLTGVVLLRETSGKPTVQTHTY